MTQMQPNYLRESRVKSEQRGGRRPDRGTDSVRSGAGSGMTAALSGMLAAIGLLVLLGGLAAIIGLPFAINATDQQGQPVPGLEIGAVLIGSIAVFVAFFVGGWIAARIARANGVIAGVGTALWTLLFVALFAGLGMIADQQWNLFQMLGLPDWIAQFRNSDVTGLLVASSLLGMIAIFAGGILGGATGEAQNRRMRTEDDRVTVESA